MIWLNMGSSAEHKILLVVLCSTDHIFRASADIHQPCVAHTSLELTQTFQFQWVEGCQKIDLWSDIDSRLRGSSYLVGCCLYCIQGTHSYRPHTKVKNARHRKSVSHTKLPFFEGIFKLWTHEQQELPFLQLFISFAYQNLAILCVKWPWNGFRSSWKFWCCMRSIVPGKSIIQND